MTARFLRVVMTIVLAAGLASAVCSSILLKPNGQNAMPLRTKSVAADVKIDRQFATTDLTLVFQNETSERIEADFMYTLPPGAVVTFFAYWFGDEKVVARVVEKERAAQIYQHITSRMRDPALIELVGKNLFRARIFPVMPNADLKVQMVYVQALPSTKNGVTYTLPLSDAGKEKNALDKIDVSVFVKADESLKGVATNMGIPVTEEADGWRVSFSGTNYRPQKDMSVRLIEKQKKPMRASLYAARSGGADGFFALALTPDHSLTSPAVKITGVQVYDVLPSKPPNVKAGEAIYLFGRYKGSGAAEIVLTGKSPNGPLTYKEHIQFSAQSEPNNLASKLWAAKKIELLSARGSNRATVLALCSRYTLPSKFASWLAIPQAERERYKREMIEADIERTAQQLSDLIVTGKGGSKRARSLRLKLNSLCKQVGRSPDYALNDWMSNRLWEVRESMMNLLAEGKGSSRTARKQIRLFRYYSKQTGQDPDEAFKRAVRDRMAMLAREVRWYDESSNWRKTRLDQMKRLEKKSGWPTKIWLAEAQRTEPVVQRESLTWQLQEAIRNKPADTAKIDELRQQIREANVRIGGNKYADAWEQYLEAEARARAASDKAQAARRSGDDQVLARLERERDSLLYKADTFNQALPYRWGDPLISIEAPADALQVVAIMPDGEVKRLEYEADSKQWQGRFDVPLHAKEGSYVITIVVVMKDGTRKAMKLTYRVDVTGPKGKPTATFGSTQDRVLRLELAADEDTARVTALLPWDERVELKPSSHTNTFFALVRLPEGQTGACAVTFILTDKAHNRTTLTLDVAR